MIRLPTLNLNYFELMVTSILYFLPSILILHNNLYPQPHITTTVHMLELSCALFHDHIPWRHSLHKKATRLSQQQAQDMFCALARHAIVSTNADMRWWLTQKIASSMSISPYLRRILNTRRTNIKVIICVVTFEGWIIKYLLCSVKNNFCNFQFLWIRKFQKGI